MESAEATSIPRTARVTVLMAAHDAERHLGAAVDSVLCQTYRDFELLVIDDGSTDGTAALLAAVDDPRLRVLRQPNSGLVAALNHGLQHAQGELVARLDADDLAAPTRLEIQVAFLDGHPGVAAVGSCYRVVDEPGHPVEVEHVAGDAAYLHRRLYFRNTFAHSSITFRRDAVHSAGGYRDVGPVEDYDLWVRLAARHELGCVPQVLLSYRRSGSGISARQRQAQLDSLAAVRTRLHREQPMPAPPIRTVVAQGIDHDRTYRGCPGALITYVFDHAGLAVTAFRMRRPLLAARMAAAVALLILLRPRAARGLRRLPVRRAS